MKLSLVVPCYNEAENVIPFQEAVIQAFAGCGYDYEIVFVDDGSQDATLHNLRKLYAAQKCPVKVVSFSRNFGKEAALYAGLKQTSGEYVSLIDADLQQRPEIVRDMVKTLDEQPEYDVVAAYQDRRGEGKVLSFFKKAFYSIINKLSDINLRSDASDFRTFRRSVAESIISLGEYHRFSKGIFAWVGYNSYFIPYVACERVAGVSKWNFWKLLLYSIEGITAFSTVPLVIASFVGVLFCILAFVAIVFIIVRKILFGDPVSGWPSLVCIILMVSGVQLFCLGIVGQYLAKTYMEVKKRPIYLIKVEL